MAWKRLYYNVAVHGSGWGTQQNLNQGKMHAGTVVGGGSSFFYVVQPFVTPANYDFCFGSSSFNVLGCRETNQFIPGLALKTDDIFTVTADDDWHVYTGGPITSGIVLAYFEVHRI